MAINVSLEPSLSILTKLKVLFRSYVDKRKDNYNESGQCVKIDQMFISWASAVYLHNVFLQFTKGIMQQKKKIIVQTQNLC